MDLHSLLLAFVTGFIVGGVFRLVHLPIPAPSTWEGILGIVGIFVGYLVLNYLLKIVGV